MHPIHTIGHSTHAIEKFIALLGGAGVDTLADVRSNPGSRWNPQFNRGALDHALSAAGIAYIYLGRELGGHPRDPALMRGGKVAYDLLAASETFRQGIAQLKKLAETSRIAIMCAEKDPLNCHRTLLVAPALAGEGFAVKHILADGGIEDHESVMGRMDAKKKRQQPRTGDLFGS